MGQPGFFDLGERYRGLDAKKDPLVVLNAVVPWEDFRAQLSAVWRKPDEERKTAAGRKPWDGIVIFKTLVLQALYNLSDDQIEYQIRDRLSFMRFLGLSLEDRVPDATTVWLYREKLAQAGLPGHGRPDRRRLHRVGARAAQQPRGEHGHQGWRSARRVDAQQEGAEG